jgi:hypothetical protein
MTSVTTNPNGIISLLDSYFRKKDPIENYVAIPNAIGTGFFGFPLEDLESVNALGVVPYNQSPRMAQDLPKIIIDGDLATFMSVHAKVDKDKVSVSVCGLNNGIPGVVHEYSDSATYGLGYGSGQSANKVTAVIDDARTLPGFDDYLQSDGSTSCAFGYYVSSVPAYKIRGYIVSNSQVADMVRKMDSTKEVWILAGGA